ncbi:MAG: S-adenosylmethionine:tRNA ribosyltransferase-isomerase, partial [Clostridiaceae bacterium]|nr:S-adenosylmethionine:tRNA ribosyltransferase-isomerase [Clostridiaceae bacterium]
MKKSDFYYDLPEELIAQHPIEPRDSSRLMRLDRRTGETEHLHFRDIVDLLNEGDCLILNNTRVLPARLYGIKDTTGAVVEFLLLNQHDSNTWEVMAGPGKKAREGAEFTFGEGILKARIKEVLENGNRIAEFSYEGN